MPRSIASILAARRSGLRSLLRQAASLQQIQAAVDAALPAEAVARVRVAACAKDRLLLIVDNSAWATRLRYQQQILLRSLAQRLRLAPATIEIRVRPAPQWQASRVRPRYLSAQSRRLIRTTAGFIDNPELARALERLARAGAGVDAGTQ